MSTVAPTIECQELEIDPDFSVAPSEVGFHHDDTDNVEAQSRSSIDPWQNNGRRYHTFKDEVYALPNDDQEAARLDLQDVVWKRSLNGGLHISPITEKITSALDVGTGTGRWAIDFARDHPQCKVIGTDLSAIQSESGLSNCTFTVQNVNEDWNWPEPFDFIHNRMLITGIRGWERYFEQAWNTLKPGGWLEAQEMIFPIRYMPGDVVAPESPLWKVSICFQEASMKLGINTLSPDRFKEMLENQGYVNVRCERFKWPMGTWPRGSKEKEIGALADEAVRDRGVPTLAMKLFTSVLGWSEEQALELLDQVKKEKVDPKSPHYYWEMVIASGQKPY